MRYKGELKEGEGGEAEQRGGGGEREPLMRSRRAFFASVKIREDRFGIRCLSGVGFLLETDFHFQALQNVVGNYFNWTS
jgi:hypothetical protein